MSTLKGPTIILNGPIAGTQQQGGVHKRTPSSPGVAHSVNTAAAAAAAATGRSKASGAAVGGFAGEIVAELRRRSTSTISVSDASRKVMERRALREELNHKLADILSRPFSRLPVHTDLPRLRRGFRVLDQAGEVVFDESKLPPDLDERSGTLAVMAAIVGELNRQHTPSDHDAVRRAVEEFTAAYDGATTKGTTGRITGQLSDRLRSLLSGDDGSGVGKCPSVGETGLVASCLKCICQDAIFPAIVMLHQSIYTRGFPFRDSKGSWRVEVRLNGPDEIVVVHHKRQQSQEGNVHKVVVDSSPPTQPLQQPSLSQVHSESSTILSRSTTSAAFEFEWCLEVKLRGWDNPAFWATACVNDFVINESVISPARKQPLLDVFAGILHPRVPFVAVWRQQELSLRPWTFFLRRVITVVDPGGDTLVEAPLPAFTFRENVFHVLLAIAEGLDCTGATTGASGRVAAAFPEGVWTGPMAAYYQFPGDPLIAMAFRLLTLDFIAPAVSRLRSCFKRHPFRDKPGVFAQTRMSFLPDGRTECRHTQTAVSVPAVADGPTLFEFTWELTTTATRGLRGLDTSLRIVDMMLYDAMSEEKRDDFILCASDLIDKDTLNRCVLLVPLQDTVEALRRAVAALPQQLLVTGDQLGGLAVPAAELLAQIGDAIAHMPRPLPEIPVRKGDVTEQLQATASPRPTFRRAHQMQQSPVPSPLAKNQSQPAAQTRSLPRSPLHSQFSLQPPTQPPPTPPQRPGSALVCRPESVEIKGPSPDTPGIASSAPLPETPASPSPLP